MAHIRLKPIVEQIQNVEPVDEATLHPHTPTMRAVEEIIVRHLNTGKFRRLGYFENLWKKFKAGIVKMTMGDDFYERLESLKSEWGDDYLDAIFSINNDLERYGISFNWYLDSTTLGAMTKKGHIILNPKLLFQAKKVDGKYQWLPLGSKKAQYRQAKIKQLETQVTMKENEIVDKLSAQIKNEYNYVRPYGRFECYNLIHYLLAVRKASKVRAARLREERLKAEGKL